MRFFNTAGPVRSEDHYLHSPFGKMGYERDSHND